MKKKKAIELSEATLIVLSKLAEADGRKLKSYLERVLVSHALEFGEKFFEKPKDGKND